MLYKRRSRLNASLVLMPGLQGLGRKYKPGLIFEDIQYAIPGLYFKRLSCCVVLTGLLEFEQKDIPSIVVKEDCCRVISELGSTHSTQC